MESLNLNKLISRFLDWKITLIFRCVNDLLTALYKPFLKFKENVPKMEEQLTIPFLVLLVQSA